MVLAETIYSAGYWIGFICGLVIGALGVAMMTWLRAKRDENVIEVGLKRAEVKDYAKA